LLNHPTSFYIFSHPPPFKVKGGYAPFNTLKKQDLPTRVGREAYRGDIPVVWVLGGMETRGWGYS